jgi:hypothetical protein
MAIAGGDGSRPADRAYADSMTGGSVGALAASINAPRRLAARITASQNAVSA